MRQILKDPEYAAGIHKLVRAARKDDVAALEELKLQFKVTPEEMEELGVSEEMLKTCVASNNTTFSLLGFAKMV